MNIFVTGATGVLGTSLVPRLVEAGYTVSAMSRTEENDDRLRGAGAHPVRVNLFDVEALKQALVVTRPSTTWRRKFHPRRR